VTAQDPRTFSLDIVEGEALASARGDRPWLGVYFRCAARYVKVFRTRDATGYLARCPACGRTTTFKVGTGGTNQRFFEVSCGGVSS
jgi:PHP family Zn ribbon phosphoesterase